MGDADPHGCPPTRCSPELLFQGWGMGSRTRSWPGSRTASPTLAICHRPNSVPGLFPQLQNELTTVPVAAQRGDHRETSRQTPALSWVQSRCRGARAARCSQSQGTPAVRLPPEPPPGPRSPLPWTREGPTSCVHPRNHRGQAGGPQPAVPEADQGPRARASQPAVAAQAQRAPRCGPGPRLLPRRNTCPQKTHSRTSQQLLS